jgi:ATP-binding cassette subfamily B protein
MPAQPPSSRAPLRRLPALTARAVRLCWTADRRSFALAAALQVVSGIGAGAQLLVGQRVLRSVLSADASGGRLSRVLPDLVALAVVALVTALADSLQNGRTRLLVERTVRHVNRRILDVAGSVDLVTFEEPAFFDAMERALRQSMASLQISMSLLGLVSTAASSLGIGIAILNVQPLLLPLVLFGYLPLWVAVGRNSSSLYSFSFGATPDDRARQVLTQILTDRRQAGEVRSFDLAGTLTQRWEDLYDVRLDGIRDMVRENDRRSAVSSVASALLVALTLGVLAALFLAGHLDVAATATGAIAIQQLGARLVAASRALGGLYENALFLTDLDTFLARQPPPAAPPAPLTPFRTLVADAITFGYPGQERPALDGVSFELRAGEVVALVGENGSGKTTLAKILAGLYAPGAGQLLWDDVPTDVLGLDHVRASTAVIFQDFARFPFSLTDNIALGDWPRADERDAIRAAGHAAGADEVAAGLADGWATILGRQFEGGVDLSGGQWQRIAVARAYFRDAPFLILDEPTAALDPRAEHDLFERLRALAHGRTVLLISHRFSTVRGADRILVLDQGAIIESGTHDDLVRADGTYAHLFTLQAAAYS